MLVCAPNVARDKYHGVTIFGDTMKHYGLGIAEGSNVTNLTVASGTSFPGSPSTGELFFRSDTGTLMVYDGSAWDALQSTQSIPIACSDETSTLTTGTKVTFRMPFSMLVNKIKASLTNAQASGNIFTVNVLRNGVSCFNVPLTINNGSKTSQDATIPAVLNSSTFNDDDEITISITQVGNGSATGLKVYFVGVV